MLKMYDTMMKNGKFTEAQNKAEKGEAVDSVSELVALCEKEGFIPRYYIDTPKDKVDRVIQDMKQYTRTLVTEEMGLGAMIEKAFKQMEEDRLRKEANDGPEDEEEAFEEDLFSEPEITEVSAEDILNFMNEEEELEDEDENLFLNKTNIDLIKKTPKF